MTTLASLNTLRTNGSDLTAQAASLSHDKGNGEAFGNIRTTAIGNIATALESAENATVPNIMAYGAARAVLQFALNHDAGSLDKADKVAIGWKDLAAASPAKRRLSQYHSRFRRIAEEYDAIPESERNELLAGKRSFLSVYDGIVKREKAAKAAEAEAEAKAEAEAAIETAKAEGKAEAEAEGTAPAPAPAMSLVDYLKAAKDAYATASAEEQAEAFDLVSELVDMANASLAPAETANAA